MAHELTFEQIQQCKKVFNDNKKTSDENVEDSKMLVQYIKKALIELGFTKIEDEEINGIISSWNLILEIDFPVFLRIAALKFKQVEFISALEDSFKAFDKSNKDYLTYDELRSIITDFGPKISLDQADSLLKELGVEQNKKFKYKEFVAKNI